MIFITPRIILLSYTCYVTLFSGKFIPTHPLLGYEALEWHLTLPHAGVMLFTTRHMSNQCDVFYLFSHSFPFQFFCVSFLCTPVSFVSFLYDISLQFWCPITCIVSFPSLFHFFRPDPLNPIYSRHLSRHSNLSSF